MARFSKMAVDAGIAERQVANAERLGVLVGQTLRGVLVELHLTAEQQDLLPSVVRKHLTVIASTVLNSTWSADPQLEPPP